MKRQRLRFFLDYGTCFWAVDDEEGFTGGLGPEDLPFSPEALREVNQFLKEYDQHYDWGCPPSEDWTTEDCGRFNHECRRILNTASRELTGQFIICNEQFELIEDRDLLDEFYTRGRGFIEERKTNYYHYKIACTVEFDRPCHQANTQRIT